MWVFSLSKLLTNFSGVYKQMCHFKEELQVAESSLKTHPVKLTKKRKIWLQNESSKLLLGVDIIGIDHGVCNVAMAKSNLQ